MKKTGKKNPSPIERFAAERCATPSKTHKSKGGQPKKNAAPRELPSERLGVPPTTPDVDAKVTAAEGAPGKAKPTEDTKAKPGRDTCERGAAGGKTMSLLDAAAHILAQGTGDPMRCKDIVDLAVQRGIWTPRTGKTPASTLYAAILRELTIKGDASRFAKTERGKFALRNSEYMREAAAKSSKA